MNQASQSLRNPLSAAAGWTFATLKASLAVIGLAALAALLLLPEQRESMLKDLAHAADPFSAATVVAAGRIEARSETVVEREQRVVTEFIAKRYRVADSAIAGFVASAYRAGTQYSVDPLLILAVMAVESRYNPVAESVMGAKGLMQVIPKFHLDKLLDHGGEDALLEPEVNIMVGAQILREYTRRFGDVGSALQMYVGAADQPTSQYANKVLAERARLEVSRKKARKQLARSA